MSPEMLMSTVAAMGALEWLVLIVLSVPPLFVIWSGRVHGGRKLLWVLLTGIFSWIAYVAFLIVTRRSDDSASGPA